MSLYSFVDTNTPSSAGKSILDDALFLYSQNKYIDEIIPQFMTLKANGLGTFDRESTLVNRVGDGAIFTSSRLNVKEIEVEFMILTQDSNELKTVQEQLSNLLYEEQMKFTFKYLRDWFYIGTVKSIEYDNPLFKTKGKIVIECNDPFRYSNEVVEVNANSTLDTSLGIGKEFKPYELEIQAAATSALNQKTRYFSPSSSLYFLGYTGSGAVTYKFDFNKGELFVNGVKRNELIDIQSDVSNWRIKQGERFAATSMQGITKCVLRFRRKEVG